MNQSLLLTQHFLDKQGIKKGLLKGLSSDNHWTADFQGKAKNLYLVPSYKCVQVLASVCATAADCIRSSQKAT